MVRIIQLDSFASARVAGSVRHKGMDPKCHSRMSGDRWMLRMISFKVYNSYARLSIERRLPPERIRDYDSILALSAEAEGRSKLQFCLLVWNIQVKCQS